ncbi:MAG TPA: phosphoribosyltransferase family protein [Thermoleophilaceae bacterium]|nr:phosphoribosyltransferase family protein [Thermoleophilaceae bacterium]
MAPPSFPSERFVDRRAAGRSLAARLLEVELDAPVVVALPRGGVPVAYEVARALDAPLDIALVRKLGAPGRPELGVGALAEDGTVVVDRDTIAALGIRRAEVEAIVARESVELDRRRALYRGDRPAVDVRDRETVLVDDGIATGVTAVAAAGMLRERGATRVVTAVPVCPASAVGPLREQLGELICLTTPPRFGGVGAWYDDFTQTSDDEVVDLLRQR